MAERVLKRRFILGNRSPRKMLSTQLSKTLRRASFVMSVTASPTRVTSGIMVLFPRPGKTLTRFMLRPRLRVTTTLLMSAKSVSKLLTLVRSSKSRFLVLWLCSMRVRLTGSSSSLMSTTHLLPSSTVNIRTFFNGNSMGTVFLIYLK